MRWSLLVVTLLAACNGVASSGGGGGGDDTTLIDGHGSSNGSGTGIDVFSSDVTNVTVEIDYETGNAPYTGNVIGFGDTFALTNTNIGRLFANKKNLTIPDTVADMEDIGVFDDEQVTLDDLTALANVHRQQHDSADTKTYYMVFVSGHFYDQSGEQPQVLGVSYGDTIVMLKDVIKSTASISNPNTERYVEQSTLTHELAHSIGLVDNGVPMVQDHKDAAHGAHCDNSNCIEYWLNEGAAAARDYALQKVLTGSTILFDDACLADVDALTGGL